MSSAHSRPTKTDGEKVRAEDQTTKARSSDSKAPGLGGSPETDALTLSDPYLALQANAARRGDVLQDLQRRSGNTAVQRLLARSRQDGPAHEYLVSEQTSRHVEAAKGSGRAMEPETQAGMERVLGNALGDVRVHTGPEADRLARTVKAKAFTSGTDIFFREGNYAPETLEGRVLLAHELGHVAQPGADVSSRRVQRQAEPAAAAAAGAAAAALAAASPPAKEKTEQGGTTTQMRYKVIVEGQESYLTPEEYSIQKQRALKLVGQYHERILTYTKDAERSHDNFMKNVHGTGFWTNPVATIADQIGGVWPPAVEMWQLPQAVLNAATASIAGGDLAKAVEQIKQAEALYNQCYRLWYTYRMGTISGAETAKKGLEITRDVSFGIAAGIGAALLLPVLIPAGAAASTTLITGAGLQAAGAGAATLLGHGTTVGVAAAMGERGALGSEYEPLAILKKAGTNAVTAFLGALVGGALAPLFQKALGGQISNLSDEALAEISKAAGPGVKVTRDYFATWAQRELAEFLADIPGNILGEAITVIIDYMETGKTVSAEEFVKRVAFQLISGAGGRQTLGRVAARQQAKKTTAAVKGAPRPAAAPEAAATAAPTPPAAAPLAPAPTAPSRLPPTEPPLPSGLPPTLPPPGTTQPGLGPGPTLPPIEAPATGRIPVSQAPALATPGGPLRRTAVPLEYKYELKRAITDIGEAQSMRDRFMLEGRSVREIPNPQTLREEWNLVLGQAGDPPPAFVASNNEIQIDTNRVGWVPRDIQRVALSLHPLGARAAARGAGAPPPGGAGTTGRIPTGEAPTAPVTESHAPTIPAPSQLPPTLPPPGKTQPGIGPGPTLPPTGGTRRGMGPPAPGALEPSLRLANNGAIYRESSARAVRDGLMLQGGPVHFLFTRERVQQEWNLVLRQPGEAPPAFFTDDGTLIVDYNRLGPPPDQVASIWARHSAAQAAGVPAPAAAPPSRLPPTEPPLTPGLPTTLPPPEGTLRGMGPPARRPGAPESRIMEAGMLAKDGKIKTTERAQALRDEYMLKGQMVDEMLSKKYAQMVWTEDLGQPLPVPPAFITKDGKLHVDRTQVGPASAEVESVYLAHAQARYRAAQAAGIPPLAEAPPTGRTPTGEAPTLPIPESQAPTLPAPPRLPATLPPGGGTLRGMGPPAPEAAQPSRLPPTEPAVRPPGVVPGEFRPLTVNQLNELFFRCFKRHLGLTEAHVVVITDAGTWRQEWVASRGRLEEADAVPAFVDAGGRIFVNGSKPEAFLLRFHEAIHHHARVVGGDRFPRRYGAFLEEGLTEWVTRLHLGPQATRTNYDRNVRFLEWIMARGVDPKVLERAYLDGDVDALRAALRSAFGDDLSVVLRFESALREIGREGTNSTALKEATYIVKTGKEPEEYM